MIVSISQPAYLPWLGYFDRIARSDVAIVLDNVMLERSSKTRFTNRNKIRTAESWTWLTVPVKTAGLGQPLICDVELDMEQNWAEKHFRSIAQSYSRAPHFAEHRDWLENFYKQPWTHLAPLLNESTSYLLDALGIDTPLLFGSEMKVEGEKSELIQNLCKHAGATTYLSGPFGRDYLDAANFADAGIALEFDDYVHPVYPQMHGGFQPYMSIVDLLFNCGDASLQILRSK
jgi:hypothetical protein